MDYNSEFLTKHLITYLGNKRKLLPFIQSGLDTVLKKLGPKVSIFDGFSGSGIVARLLKSHASSLHVNDLENYTHTLNRCYLQNEPEVDYKSEIDFLNSRYLDDREPGFFENNYAPKDEDRISPEDRVFYTKENARIIDQTRAVIFDDYGDSFFPYLMSPLLVKSSVHTNTSGIFKGFHKKGKVGHYGGSGENALTRIKGKIVLEYPVFLNNDCEVHLYKEDTNSLVEYMPAVDVAYYDPPYNQHPYGSNYFMLNLINNRDDNPEIQDGVSGISVGWNRSDYNKRGHAADKIEHLIAATQSKFIIMSYNNEGIVSFDRIKDIFSKYGHTTILTQDYNTYRGSRNLSDRDIKIKEMLWVLEKK